MNSNAVQFAIACYDGNSMQELVEGLNESPDMTDCQTWGISPEEWKGAIELAFRARSAGLSISDDGSLA